MTHYKPGQPALCSVLNALPEKCVSWTRAFGWLRNVLPFYHVCNLLKSIQPSSECDFPAQLDTSLNLKTQLYKNVKNKACNPPPLWGKAHSANTTNITLKCKKGESVRPDSVMHNLVFNKFVTTKWIQVLPTCFWLEQKSIHLGGGKVT